MMITWYEYHSIGRFRKCHLNAQLSSEADTLSRIAYGVRCS